MAIEELRWAPLSSDLVKPKPGAFGWSHPMGSTAHEDPYESMEFDDNWFLFDADHRKSDDASAGAYFSRFATEFASEPWAWRALSGSYDDLSSEAANAFTTDSTQKAKAGRIIDVDIDEDGTFNAIFVPNYGQFYRPWTWYHGISHVSTIKKILKGEAVGQIPAGPKMRLVTITEHPTTHHISIVVENVKKGDGPYWWGVGLPLDDIRNNIANGLASEVSPSDFPQDNIKKRLVLLEGHRRFETITSYSVIPAHEEWAPPESPDEENPALNPNELSEPLPGDPGYEQAEASDPGAEIYVPQQTVTHTYIHEDPPVFLFMMLPNNDNLKWNAYGHAHWQTISNYATKNNLRVIDLHPFDTEKERFSAVFVQNN
jgi:hypothetical protein